jgi:polyphosphate kinase
VTSPIKTTPRRSRREPVYPRELSWLSFNARVLQEAADPSVPEIQRLRYLGIFSNNLDEFFRVRVAEVRRLISVSSGTPRQQAKELLAAIQARSWRCSTTSSASIKSVMEALQARRIYMINERELDRTRRVRAVLLHETLLPELDPILFVPGSPIPCSTTSRCTSPWTSRSND